MKDFSVFSMDFSGFFREFSARKDAEISKMTTFGVGGRTALAVYPESVARLAAVVAFAAKSDVPVLVLGGGSNVLVSDAGFSGIVIRAGGVLRGILPCRGGFWAAAGTYLGEIFRFSRDNDLGGFEFLRSIPGAVGASVVGNAGCFGGEIAKRAKIVQALDLKNLRNFSVNPDFAEPTDFSGKPTFRRSKTLLLRGNSEETRPKISFPKTNLRRRKIRPRRFFRRVTSARLYARRRFFSTGKLSRRSIGGPRFRAEDFS